MSIAVMCGGCFRQLKAKDSSAGRRLKCPSCGAEIAVPRPTIAETFPPLSPTPTPRPAPVVVTSPTVFVPAGRPADRPRSGRRPWLGLAVGVAVGLGVCVAGAAGYLVGTSGDRAVPAGGPKDNVSNPAVPAPEPARGSVSGMAWVDLAGGGTRPVSGMVVRLIPRSLPLRILSGPLRIASKAVDRQLADRGLGGGGDDPAVDKLRLDFKAGLDAWAVRSAEGPDSDGRLDLNFLRAALRESLFAGTNNLDHLKFDRLKGEANADPGWTEVVGLVALGTTHTRPDGRYEMAGVLPGAYYLAASHQTVLSALEWMVPVDVSEGESVVMDLYNQSAALIVNSDP